MKQRLIVKLFKQSYISQRKRDSVTVFSILAKIVLVSIATSRHELAIERSGMHSVNTLVFHFGVKINPV